MCLSDLVCACCVRYVFVLCVCVCVYVWCLLFWVSVVSVVCVVFMRVGVCVWHFYVS